MTATVNADCTEIVLSDSELLSTFIANSGLYTLALEYDKNCCDNPQSFSVLLADDEVDTDEETFTISPTYFGSGLTEIASGLYLFTFKLTTTATGAIQEESVCVLVDCNLECVVFDFIANETKDIKNRVEAAMRYLTLQSIQLCDDCKCDKACRSYIRLNKLINNTSNCGCN